MVAPSPYKSWLETFHLINKRQSYKESSVRTSALGFRRKGYGQHQTGAPRDTKRLRKHLAKESRVSGMSAVPMPALKLDTVRLRYFFKVFSDSLTATVQMIKPNAILFSTSAAL